MADEPTRQAIEPSKPPRFRFSPELAELTPAEFVEEIQNYYFSTNPETGRLVLTPAQAKQEGLQFAEPVEGDHPWVFPNNTTPKKILPLLEFLRLFTVEISRDIDQPHIEEALGAIDSARIRKEFEAWEARLRQYQTHTATAIGLPKKPGTQFEEFFMVTVVNPLLRGWFPGDPTQHPPDMITPLTLARQAEITTQNMQEAWRKLGDDLVQGFKDAVQTGGSILIPTLIAAALVAAAAYGFSKGR